MHASLSDDAGLLSSDGAQWATIAVAWHQTGIIARVPIKWGTLHRSSLLLSILAVNESRKIEMCNFII